MVIKLGKKFSNISLLYLGSNYCSWQFMPTLIKNYQSLQCENSIGGLEFLSCIPGTIGGGLKMNSGCFEKEFKDILLSPYKQLTRLENNNHTSFKN